jgi:hyperosmotically inducible periplasmic protein
MIPKLLVLSCLAAVTFPACGGMSIRPASSSAAVDDATISARVKTTLLNDPQVGALKIDVTTSKGVVTMSGTVKSQAEAERAIQLARQTSGVRDVISNLKPQT